MGLVQVVAGVLRNEHHAVLAGVRSTGRAFAECWEFPGGKLEEGEGCEEAVVREWKEELGRVVRPGRLLFHGTFTNGSGYHLTALEVHHVEGPPDGWVWTSHTHVDWLDPLKLLQVPPDRATPSLRPILRALLKL